MFTGFIVNTFSKIDNQINNIYNTFITFVRFKEKFEIRKQFFFFAEVQKVPIHLISDYTLSRSAPSEEACITGYLNRCNESDMRYMLLHELQHYKHHDAIGSFLMNLAGVVYWFNPFVWYALKKMCNDREVACDTSVLEMLADDAYEDYGTALINFTEKVSLTPFPFAAGLSGNRKQIKQRISNIASYEKPTFIKKLKSLSMERLLRKYFLHRPICILWRI